MTHIRKWQPFSSAAPLAGFPFSEWFGFNPGISNSRTSRALGVDVIRNDEGYVVEASLPGVSPDDIDVTIDGSLLKIRATAGEDETKSDSSYILRERRRGSYYRALRLPRDIDTENASTEYRDGVLSVTLPAPDSNGSKRLPVNFG